MFKTVLKSNLKRYWWIFGLNIALIFISFMLPVITDRSIYGHVFYFSDRPVFIIYAIVFGALNGWSVFSYMNSSRAVNLYHSLPSTKTAIFGANVVYGLVSEILPMLFSLLLIPLVNGHGYDGVDETLTVSYILLPALSAGLAVFAVACFTVMFSGNAVAGKVFTPIIAFLPFAGEAFFSSMREVRLFGGGYGGYDDMSLSGVIYGLGYYDGSIQPSFWVQLGLAALMLILAYVAYRRRKMENAGEIVTVKWAKVLFVQGVAFCFGVTISYIAWDGFTYIGTIIIGLIACAAAMMILQKTYRIKGFVKQAVGFACIVGALALIYEADITGFERRVPDPAKVKTVSFTTDDYSGNWLTTSDPGLIEMANSAHKAIVADRPENVYSCKFRINYELSNGRTLSRTYHLSADDRDKYLKELLDSHEYRTSLYNLDQEWKTAKIYNLEVHGHDNAVRYVDYVLTPAEIARVREALAYDLQTLSYDELYNPTYSPDDKPTFYLSLDQTRELVLGREYLHSPMLVIEPYMPHAYAVLEEIGKSVRDAYSETDADFTEGYFVVGDLPPTESASNTNINS